MTDKLLEALRVTLHTYKEFGQSSMVTLLFLAALLYLWLKEEDKSRRMVLVYLSTALLAVFFFPVFAYLAMTYFLDTEIYYRFLWLIPSGIIVCYGIVRLIDSLRDKKKAWTAGILAALVIMIQGSLIYQNDYVTRAENKYHLPRAAVEVAETIGIENEWVKAVVPAELIQFIRQYDSMIMMPYGREMLIDRWEMNHELYVAMESEVIHAEYVALLCRESQVDYIVVREYAQIGGDFEEFGFKKLQNVSGYDIYMDVNSKLYERKAEELK